MAFALKHCITKNAIDDLLKVLAAHLPEDPVFPETLHQVFKKNFMIGKTN